MRIVPPLAEADLIQLGLMISTGRLFQIKGYKVSADKFGLGLRDRVFLAVVQRQQHLRRATPPPGGRDLQEAQEDRYHFLAE